MKPELFRHRHGEKFKKWIESDMGQSFLRVLEHESPSRKVSAVQGDAQQAIAHTESCRAYGALVNLIDNLQSDKIEKQEDQPGDFAPPNVLDREIPRGRIKK